MSKKYVSSEVISEWFGEFDEDKGNWIIDEIVDNLFNALADTNQLLKDCEDEQDEERLHTINTGIVSALTDLRRLMKEVGDQIAEGEILEMGAKRR